VPRLDRRPLQLRGHGVPAHGPLRAGLTLALPKSVIGLASLRLIRPGQDRQANTVLPVNLVGCAILYITLFFSSLN
jgi:hypothetical protein